MSSAIADMTCDILCCMHSLKANTIYRAPQKTKQACDPPDTRNAGGPTQYTRRNAGLCTVNCENTHQHIAGGYWKSSPESREAAVAAASTPSTAGEAPVLSTRAARRGNLFRRPSMLVV